MYWKKKPEVPVSGVKPPRENIDEMRSEIRQLVNEPIDPTANLDGGRGLQTRLEKAVPVEA